MKTHSFFLPLLLAASALVSAASGQTITFTTTGTLETISGPDKLALNGTSFTVTNALTTGQTPITGTTNQYSTTLNISASSLGFNSSVPGVVTINYLGPNSPQNNISITGTIKILVNTINLASTVFVPTIPSASPAPIVSTPLTLTDSLTLGDTSSQTVYGFSTGTVSSSPAGSGCTYTVSPGSLSFTQAGGNASLTVTGSPSNPGGCSWTASANQSFIQLSPTSGTANGTVVVTVPANTTSGTLSGTITIGGQTVTVTEAGAVGCTFTVSPPSLSFPSTGGSTPVTITASSPGCAWTASSGDPWLSVGTSSGTGNGTVLVTSLANTTSGTLNGTLTIAGQTIPVTESGVLTCTFTVTPPSASFPIGGGNITLTVTASNPSCSWTAASDQSWAMLSSMGSTGNGSIVVTASPNSGTAALTATISIADQSVPLLESGTTNTCSFAVAPTVLNFPGASTGITVGIAASSSSCAWNASLVPTWVTLNATYGYGNGSVVVTASPNTGTSVRTGNLTLAGVTLSLTQLSTAGCTFTVTPSTLNYGSAGGTSNITIKAASDICTWTASSNQSWITVSPTTGTGNGTVAVTTVPNNTANFLSGSVNVAGQVVTVSQGGVSGCIYTVSPSSLDFAGSGGVGTLVISTNYQTCPWTAVSNQSWSPVNPASGTGNGTVQVTASTNTTPSTLTGTLTVAGQTISLTETTGSGCSFTVPTSTISFSSTGGSATKGITASGVSCAWTATSNAPFITVSPASGTGNGSVTITVGDDSTGAPQSGTVTIAGQIIQVMEAGGCTATVSPASFALDSNGGVETITVNSSSSACTYTAFSSVPWATVSAATGSGSGSLTVTVTPNTTGADLAGTITVAGVNIPVTEAFTVQTFTDVPPSAYYFDAVNLMASKGITNGCGPGLYCPTQNLTRAQMAVFLVRSVYGNDLFSYNPTPYFTDVPVGSFGFQWIQKLYELGITTGCAPTLFCPTESVTRDQLAAFLIRTQLGATTQFDYPGLPYFTDVPTTYWAFSYIQRLAEEKITSGCSPTLFCPTEATTRGDMAILLIRAAYNLLLPAGTPVISSISPATISPGQSQTYSIIGTNTNFVQGTTTVTPMPGFTASDIIVISPTQLSVTLTAPGNAPLQPESILVITGSEEAVLPNGLSVQ